MEKTSPRMNREATHADKLRAAHQLSSCLKKEQLPRASHAALQMSAEPKESVKRSDEENTDWTLLDFLVVGGSSNRVRNLRKMFKVHISNHLSLWRNPLPALHILHKTERP